MYHSMNGGGWWWMAVTAVVAVSILGVVIYAISGRAGRPPTDPTSHP